MVPTFRRKRSGNQESEEDGPVVHFDSRTDRGVKRSRAESDGREFPTRSDVEDDVAKLAARVRAMGEGVERDRLASQIRVHALEEDLARAEASTERTKALEEEAERSRAELSACDDTIRKQREDLEAMRQRLEGFEGIKRAMQQL